MTLVIITVISILCITIASFGSVGAFENVESSETIINHSLLQTLKTKENADIFVSLRVGVSKAYSQTKGKVFETRGLRIESLRSALIENADQSQPALKEFLDTKGINYTGFWITNKIFVQNANIELVNELASFGMVDEIREPVLAKITPQHQGKLHSSSSMTSINKVEWGLTKIKAEEHWTTYGRGEGIVVANIDTGVRGTHEILKNNFLGQYGWLDPVYRIRDPYDLQGHGTHCMGTTVGQNGYGVAPAAKWMACIGCIEAGCPELLLLACAQFVLCPTDTNGLNPDCTKTPNIVSNSWGGQTSRPFFDDAIAAWHVAGIIPIFAAGNSGPDCSTIGSPADRDVISVGSTGIDDTLSKFSSAGPSVSGAVLPHITAPGENILSASNMGDDEYLPLRGTSMAAPHVSGAVALILGNNPGLTYDEIKTVLFGGAHNSSLIGQGKDCDGKNESVFPNNAFGYGRLDVLASGKLAKSLTDSKNASPTYKISISLLFLSFVCLIFKIDSLIF